MTVEGRKYTIDREVGVLTLVIKIKILRMGFSFLVIRNQEWVQEFLVEKTRMEI